MLAILLAGIAAFFGRQANQNAIVATSRELAAAAISNLDADPERSILLALQAVDKTYTIDHTVLPEAEDALHRAVQASQVELTLRGHTDSVASVAFSPDGKRIATASADGTAKIWDAVTGKELLTIKASTKGWVGGIAYSPNGKLLATAEDDKTARIWDATTGKELMTLNGHTDILTDVAFSPDGTHLATASWDGTAKVWEVLTGKEELTVLSTNHCENLSTNLCENALNTNTEHG